MTAQEEFQLEQYKSLRSEISNNIAEIRSLQRFAVIGVAAVWAWIAVNAASAPRWAAFTPLIFVVLGAVYSRQVLREMGEQGTFIASVIEPTFCGDQSGVQTGWENWIRRVPEGDRNFVKTPAGTGVGPAGSYHNPGSRSAPISVEWIVLFVVIVVVGSLQAWHPVTHAPEKTAVACCSGTHC